MAEGEGVGGDAVESGAEAAGLGVHPAAWSEPEWAVFFNEWAKHRNLLRSDDKEDVPHVVAAAALDRIVNLYDGIWVLQEGHMGLLSGLLVRHAFECWVIGLYLCLEGSAALTHLNDAEPRALSLLASKHPNSRWADEFRTYEGRTGRRLNIEDIAARLGTELRRRDLPPLDPRIHYDTMYRAESRGAVQCRNGCATPAPGNRRQRALADRIEADGLADDVALTWTLTYAAHLSGFVFEAFGLPRGVVDNVLWRCIDLFAFPWLSVRR